MTSSSLIVNNDIFTQTIEKVFFFLYLAEAGHMLIRNVNYEIPSLKRQIAKCQQTQRVSHFNL